MERISGIVRVIQSKRWQLESMIIQLLVESSIDQFSNE